MGQVSSLATEVDEFRLIFKNGPLIRGEAKEIQPTFREKVRLLFSKDFKVLIAGHPVKSTFFGKAKAIFSRSFKLRKQGEIIGRCLFETALKELGYSKKELDRWVERGLLRKTTTRYQGGWRNTYVLIDSKEGEPQS